MSCRRHWRVAPYGVDAAAMPLLHLILVALIQGVTEFLPVSSSGHLVLVPLVTGYADQGLAVDVAVHVGTLIAVVAYFRAEVAIALAGLADLARGRTRTPGARLAAGLAIATVPVVLAGLALELTGAASALRSVAVIGWAMLGFGIVLWWADRFPQRRTDADWTPRHALILGLWQAVALIPGTSRSGIVITGARALGYDREAAARLAMLMSVPTILAAGTLLGIEASAAPQPPGFWRDLTLAAALAAVSAFAALALMMRLLRSVSFTPYVLYRIALGAVLLAWAYS